ncbi:MAG: GTPase, partial [Alphaproteobacteria bacterium]
DIPGLIEGAHQGAGLGDRFLGHIERCGALLHLIDGTVDDPVSAWRTVRDEIASYGNGLADKPEITALNKCDALDEQTITDLLAELREAGARTVMPLSGVTGAGVTEVLRALIKPVLARRAEEGADQDSQAYAP